MSGLFSKFACRFYFGLGYGYLCLMLWFFLPKVVWKKGIRKTRPGQIRPGQIRPEQFVPEKIRPGQIRPHIPKFEQ